MMARVVFVWVIGIWGTALYAQCDRADLLGFPSSISAAPGSQNEVAIEDIDADGDLDVVFTNADEDRIAVRFGFGTGLWGDPVYYESGSEPHDVCAADLDSDGDLDLVVTNINGRSISVYENNGAGFFAEQVVYSVGSGPIAVSAADLDNDGRVDVVVGNSTSESLSILLNQGDMVFADAVTVPATNDLRALVLEDFDQDGNVDIAYLQFSSSGDDLYILGGHGDGTFSSAEQFDAGDRPRVLTCGDIDGDGYQDLLVGGGYESSLMCFVNQGNGEFIRHTVAENALSSGLDIADIDGDGFVDILGSNTSSIQGRVFVLFGNGTLSFDLVSYTAVSSSLPRGVYAADMNNDGAVDLVRNTLSALYILNNTCPKACNSMADLNGDGVVNFFDAAWFINLYQSDQASADLTGDGVLNFYDVSLYLEFFTAACP